MGTIRKLLQRMSLVSGKIWMELAHFCKNDTNKPHTCKCMAVQGELFGRQNAQLSPHSRATWGCGRGSSEGEGGDLAVFLFTCAVWLVPRSMYCFCSWEGSSNNRHFQKWTIWVLHRQQGRLPLPSVFSARCCTQHSQAVMNTGGDGEVLSSPQFFS